MFELGATVPVTHAVISHDRIKDAREFPTSHLAVGNGSSPPDPVLLRTQRSRGQSMGPIRRDTHYRTPLLDVNVTPMTVEDMRAGISSAVGEGHRLAILAHRRNTAYLLPIDDEYSRPCDEIELVVIEDMPIRATLLLSRVLGGRWGPSAHSGIGSSGWLALAAQLPRVERVLCLGDLPASNEMAVRLLQRRTAARVLGIPEGRWPGRDMPVLAHHIRSFSPQVLLLGTGIPAEKAGDPLEAPLTPDTERSRTGTRHWATWDAEQVAA